MAEKWTKTSSPVWRWMNPKPLLALNHFTVPCSLFTSRFSFQEKLSDASTAEPDRARLRLSLGRVFRPAQRAQKKAASWLNTLRPLHDSKDDTRATNAGRVSHKPVNLSSTF